MKTADRNLNSTQPWSALRTRSGRESAITPRFGDMLSMFRQPSSAGRQMALRYFDGGLDHSQLDELSDRLAAWLLRQGVHRCDRVMLILQNSPQFVLAVIAAWKVGATPTPVNPMYTLRELRLLIDDCNPKVIICEDGHAAATDSSALRNMCVLTTTAESFAYWHQSTVFGIAHRTVRNDELLQELQALAGHAPPAIALTSAEIGLLLYTSGTTGTPKGVMLSHGNLAFNTEAGCRWAGLAEGTRILALAPLFHVTGFVLHLCATVFLKGCMSLTYRFEAGTVLEVIRHQQPQFSVGAITAFIALMNAPGVRRSDFECFETLYTGGAPTPPAVAREFHDRFGRPILTAYGMTETCAPTLMTPPGCNPPVDESTGALAIGIPISNVEVQVVDDNGAALVSGEPGELLIRGPMVMSGYLNKPMETAAVLCDGWIRTGDVVVMDRAGWFYLVDRKKDVIIASGFKVWPREVEDVLYTHPAVMEAAVVAMPDGYRGETVKAYIVPKSGASLSREDIISFCRMHMASYKVPRLVELRSELPKTITGKIMRSALRNLND